MKEIYHCCLIKAPLNDVYSALTKRSGLSAWWTKSSDSEDKVGTISTFRFKSGAFNRMKIKSLSQKKIEWVCVDGHDEWINTQITFELRRENRGTKVCFSHYGWNKQSEYTGECSFHWARYLVSLKNLCEIGQGIPDEGV